MARTPMSGSDGLSMQSAAARYESEQAQGASVAGGIEGAWGWTGPAGELRAQRRADFLVEAARLGPGVTCLELGAGTGEFTKRLAGSGCELTAIELSGATAKLCRERAGSAAEVVVGNIETGEGLAGRRFDAMVGVSVLHHVNMEACIANTFTSLAPAGRFAFSEPNMANPQIWAERHIDWVRRRRHVTEHETAFRVRELRAVFENAGFSVTVCRPFEFLHPSTPQRAIPGLRRLERQLERTPLRAIAGSIQISGYRP